MIGRRGARFAARIGTLLWLPWSVAAQVDTEAIDKRMQLAEFYARSASVAKIEGGGSQTAKIHLREFHQALEEARGLQAAGELEAAAARVGKALRAMAAATAALRRHQQPDDEVQQRNARLKQEIQGYRASFLLALRQKGPAAAGLLDLALLDELLHRADSFTAEGDHAGGRQVLEEAYQMTVSALARLRENETLVYSLEFRTPADEFRYEDGRFDGYWLLVQEMRAQGKGEGPSASLIERFLLQAQTLNQQADDLASAGRYSEAIARMEEANRSLARALQSMGLPIPGN